MLGVKQQKSQYLWILTTALHCKHLLRHFISERELTFTAVCTIVQKCCKGDSPCQWNIPIIDPQRSKTPEPIDIKLDLGDYVGDITSYTNFGVSTLRGARVHIREIVIIRAPVTFLLSCAPAQFAPFDRFSWFMAQKTWFHSPEIHVEKKTSDVQFC